MQTFKTICILLIATVFVTACDDWDEFKEHLIEGEKVYPAIATKIKAYPGNKRVKFTWPKSIDTRIQYYRVYWNNYSDSIQIDASNIASDQLVEVLINNLPESSYSFTVYSYDKAGNKSVPSEIPSINIYGQKYVNSLLNRPVNRHEYIDSTHALTLSYGTADTVHVYTKIQYIDTLGKQMSVYLPDSISHITLYPKPKSVVTYLSAFKPSQIAIDTFWVSQADSLILSQ